MLFKSAHLIKGPATLSFNKNNNAHVEEKKWECVNDTIIVSSHQPTFHLLFPKAACRRYRLPSTVLSRCLAGLHASLTYPERLCDLPGQEFGILQGAFHR